jgi:hypothetical protein
MKRVRNQLRIHWMWLKKEKDPQVVADHISAWMRQVSLKHKCIDKEDGNTNRKEKI